MAVARSVALPCASRSAEWSLKRVLLTKMNSPFQVDLNERGDVESILNRLLPVLELASACLCFTYFSRSNWQHSKHSILALQLYWIEISLCRITTGVRVARLDSLREPNTCRTWLVWKPQPRDLLDAELRGCQPQFLREFHIANKDSHFHRTLSKFIRKNRWIAPCKWHTYN